MAQQPFNSQYTPNQPQAPRAWRVNRGGASGAGGGAGGPANRQPMLSLPVAGPPPHPTLISPTGQSLIYLQQGASIPPQFFYSQQRPVHHHPGPVYPVPSQPFVSGPHPQAQYLRPQQAPTPFYQGQPSFIPQQQQQPVYVSAPAPPPQQQQQHQLQQQQQVPPQGAQPLSRRARSSAVVIRDPNTNKDVTSEVLSSASGSQPVTPRSGTPGTGSSEDSGFKEGGGSVAAAAVAGKGGSVIVMKDPETNESISREMLMMSPEEKKDEGVLGGGVKEESQEEEKVVEEKVEPEVEAEVEPEGDLEIVDEVGVSSSVLSPGDDEKEVEEDVPEEVVVIDVATASQSATDDQKILQRNDPDEVKNVPDEVKEDAVGVVSGEMEEAEAEVEIEEEDGQLDSITDSARVGEPDVREAEEEEEEEEESEELEDNKENEEKEEGEELSEGKPADEGPRINYEPGQWNPSTKMGAMKYNRSFLLQFQQMCVVKPSGLAKVECVMDKMIPDEVVNRAPVPGYRSAGTGSSGRRTGRGGSGSAGADALAPSWMRGSERPSKGSRPSKQQKVIEMKTVERLERSENAWVRMSERSTEVVTDDADRILYEEVLRKARGILNKLTPEKFEPLCQQMMDLEITSELRLTGVMDVVFEKAITEPGFSVAYAWLCHQLATIKVPLADGSPGNVSFRKLLLTRCQKEFEKDKQSLSLDEIKEKVDAIENEEERAKQKEELLEQEFRARRRSLGNVRFIGELYKLNLLTEAIMHECILKLLKSSDQESLECMCRLMTTVGQRLDTEKAVMRMEQYFDRIKKLTEAKKIPSRVRFMLQDLVELRKNKWVPRREGNNPKTLGQIRKEVARDEQQQKIQLQQQHAKKEKESGTAKAGQDRRRGAGPAKGSLPQTDQSWQISTSRSSRVQAQGHAFDAEKFATIKDKPRGREDAVRLGPSSKWSQPKGSSSPNVNEQRKVIASGRGRGSGAKPEVASVPGARKGSGGGLTLKEKGREQVQALIAQMPMLMHDQKKGHKAAVSPTLESESPVSGSRPESPVKECPDEEVERKTATLVKEFCNVEDIREAIQCVMDLNSPSKLALVARVATETSLERSDKDRRLTGKLIRELVQENILTVEDYFKGLGEILEFGDDMVLDIPQFWDYIGSIVGSVVAGGKISSTQLQDGLGVISPSSREKLFVAIANMLEKEEAGIALRRSVWSLALDFPLREKLLRGDSNEVILSWMKDTMQRVGAFDAPFVRALSWTVLRQALREREGDGGWVCSVDEIGERASLIAHCTGDDSSKQYPVLEAANELAADTNYFEGVLGDLFKAIFDSKLVRVDVFRLWLARAEEDEKAVEALLRQAKTFVDSLDGGRSPNQT